MPCRVEAHSTCLSYDPAAFCPGLTVFVVHPCAELPTCGCHVAGAALPLPALVPVKIVDLARRHDARCCGQHGLLRRSAVGRPAMRDKRGDAQDPGETPDMGPTELKR